MHIIGEISPRDVQVSFILRIRAVSGIFWLVPHQHRHRRQRLLPLFQQAMITNQQKNIFRLPLTVECSCFSADACRLLSAVLPVLSGEESEKSQGEDTGAGSIGAVFGAWIGDLSKNLGKMGKIVLHKNLRDAYAYRTLRISRTSVCKKN